jgi:thioesterase domain-containing protein
VNRSAIGYIGLLDMPPPNVAFDEANDTRQLGYAIEAYLSSPEAIRTIGSELLTRLRAFAEECKRDSVAVERLERDILSAPGQHDLEQYHRQFMDMQLQTRHLLQNVTPAIHSPLHLCWAQDSGNREAAQTLDWSALTTEAAANVNHRIQADHYRILEPPYALEIAELVRAVDAT